MQRTRLNLTVTLAPIALINLTANLAFRGGRRVS